MLHACVQRFDVTENLEKFYKILGTKQALYRKYGRILAYAKPCMLRTFHLKKTDCFYLTQELAASLTKED
jgi:predicted DNA-binding WGR domain protein